MFVFDLLGSSSKLPSGVYATNILMDGDDKRTVLGAAAYQQLLEVEVD